MLSDTYRTDENRVAKRLDLPSSNSIIFLQILWWRHNKCAQIYTQKQFLTIFVNFTQKIVGNCWSVKIYVFDKIDQVRSNWIIWVN